MIKKIANLKGRIDCPKCFSLLEWDNAKDIKVSNGNKYIICPECGQSLILKKGKDYWEEDSSNGSVDGITVYDTIPENLQEGDVFTLNTMLAIVGSSEEDTEIWGTNYYKYYAIDAETLPIFPVYNVAIIINNVAYNYFDGEWHETPVVGRANEFPSEEDDAYELLQYVDQENYIKAGVIIKETPNYARSYVYYNGKVDTNENYISEMLFPEYADSY